MRHSLDKARVQKANKKQKSAPSGGFDTTVNTMMGLRRLPSRSERRAALLFALLFWLVVTHKYSDIHRSLLLLYTSPGPRRRALLPGAKQTAQRVHTTSTHVDAPVDALVVVC